MKNSLTLKWGTLKGWSLKSEKALSLLQEYIALGVSLSVMTQRDTPEQKEILYKLIDECDDEESIYLDWDGVYVTRQEAKEYLMTYGKDTVG